MKTQLLLLSFVLSSFLIAFRLFLTRLNGSLPGASRRPRGRGWLVPCRGGTHREPDDRAREWYLGGPAPSRFASRSRFPARSINNSLPPRLLNTTKLSLPFPPLSPASPQNSRAAIKQLARGFDRNFCSLQRLPRER
jgi:hypothetical protein